MHWSPDTHFRSGSALSRRPAGCYRNDAVGGARLCPPFREPGFGKVGMKGIAWLGAAIVCGWLASASAAQAQAQHFIVNQLSGRCLDVAGAPGTANGALLTLYDCELSGRNPNGSQTDQRWQFLPNGLIRNALSGRCIDVPGAPGVTNGARLILYDCETSGRNPNGSQTDQRWEMLSSGLIRNVLSGKCIDVAGNPGRSNGAAILLYTCEVAGGQSDQYWRLR